MDRREALAAGTGLLAMGIMAANAAEMSSHDHHHHAAAAPSALALAAADCLQKGQVCLDHCVQLLGEGDRAMASCAQMVAQMQAVCAGLQRLANARSKYLPQMARLAQEVCRDCEAECRKHADKHAECRACMEGCATCARECQKVSA